MIAVVASTRSSALANAATDPSDTPASTTQLTLADAAVQEFTLGINAGLIAALGAEVSPLTTAALERRLSAYRAPASWKSGRTLRYA